MYIHKFNIESALAGFKGNAGIMADSIKSRTLTIKYGYGIVPHVRREAGKQSGLAHYFL